jgi:GDP-mannose 6-dehydrogenase
LIASLLKSNEEQIKNTLNLVQKAGSRKVGMFGLSFKPGTDDLRESPLVSLVELLIGKGYDVKIHDPNVSLAKVMGSNKEYIDRVIPHISRLMAEDVADVMGHADILVFGHNNELYRSLKARLKPKQKVVDLVRLWLDYRDLGTRYHGISWG